MHIVPPFSSMEHNKRSRQAPPSRFQHFFYFFRPSFFFHTPLFGVLPSLFPSRYFSDCFEPVDVFQGSLNPQILSLYAAEFLRSWLGTERVGIRSLHYIRATVCSVPHHLQGFQPLAIWYIVNYSLNLHLRNSL